MIKVVFWLLVIVVIGGGGFCLWAWVTEGADPRVSTAPHLHPDAIAEVEAITGSSFYDNSWQNPLLGTATGNAAVAGAEQQVIATVCASRQQRGLPTYI